jgi:hypothetical protein
MHIGYCLQPADINWLYAPISHTLSLLPLYTHSFLPIYHGSSTIEPPHTGNGRQGHMNNVTYAIVKSIAVVQS